MKLDEMTLDVNQQVEVKAAIGDVFRSMLHRFGEGFTSPNGESLQMILEQWPGGRWFRDRGNGVGHLWGHVQTIKAPTLLELSGPMFMSYPAINHVEIKLEEIAGGTKLALRHRAIGLIEEGHREGVNHGWEYMVNKIAEESLNEPASAKKAAK
jgi:hypothetical protein